MCQVLAAGAAAAQAPAPAPSDALPCPAPGAAQPPLLGGYRALDPQTAPVLTQQLAPLAWQAYSGRSALGACPAGSAKLASASVQRACQQARVTSLRSHALPRPFACVLFACMLCLVVRRCTGWLACQQAGVCYGSI